MFVDVATCHSISVRSGPQSISHYACVRRSLVSGGRVRCVVCISGRARPTRDGRAPVYALRYSRMLLQQSCVVSGDTYFLFSEIPVKFQGASSKTEGGDTFLVFFFKSPVKRL